jgi:outer membrane protein OmpA-like peptidoglycan-associated protein
MGAKLLGLILIISSVFTSVANANICGTDYQNFNPLTSGLDFVTVHSSETLSPCLINLGFFVNYSRNTLTYTQDTASRAAGDKLKDQMWSADASLGIGITDRWDAGISVPFVFSTQVEDPTFTSYFEERGVTEIRLNTKYRLMGDRDGGIAVVGTANFNQIQNNPYVGTNGGPIFGAELVADTSVKEWAFAANAGYRKRNPGTQIAGVPITPVGDQATYSGAVSYLVNAIDTRLVAEIMGATVVDNGSDGQSSLEGLFGMKKNFRNDAALHFGVGTALQKGTASPDSRVYAGVNWTFGPICNETSKSEAGAYKVTDYVDTKSQKKYEVTEITFRAEILFDFDSDKLKPKGEEALRKVAEHLKSQDFEKMIIEGHTDSIGAAQYNLDLSRRRANTVKEFLSSKERISRNKLQAVGYGKVMPIADNGNAQGRRENRRVEFKIYRKQAVQ